MLNSFLDFGKAAIDRKDVESNIQRDEKCPADRLNLEFVNASDFEPLSDIFKNMASTTANSIRANSICFLVNFGIVAFLRLFRGVVMRTLPMYVAR